MRASSARPPLAFSAFPELKHVILADEDVRWATNTRFRGDRDIITIPGVRCHPLDPSAPIPP